MTYEQAMEAHNERWTAPLAAIRTAKALREIVRYYSALSEDNRAVLDMSPQTLGIVVGILERTVNAGKLLDEEKQALMTTFADKARGMQPQEHVEERVKGWHEAEWVKEYQRNKIEKLGG